MSVSTTQAECLRHRQGERGAALVIVLAALIVLTVIAVAYNASTRIEMSVARNFRNQYQAKCLAEAGVFRVIGELKSDTTYYDAYSDSWSYNPQRLGKFEMGRGYYSVLADDLDDDAKPRIGIVDEAGKVNINVADREWLEKLPNMTPDKIAPILDWRDQDTDRTSELGAEREYYLHLPEPYECKNAPFDTIMELLLVKNITQTDLFGEDMNLNGILDKAEDDGDEHPPSDNKDGKLDPGWWPYITVYSYDNNMAPDDKKKLNINKASRGALASRLGDFLEEEQIQAIVDFRGDQEDKYKSLADLLNVTFGKSNDKAIDKDDFKAIANYVTVYDEERIPGMININTAPLAVLKTLPEMTDSVAEALVTRRMGPGGEFQSVADLLDIKGLEDKAFRAMLPRITVRSNVFRVISYGYVGEGEAVAITNAVVDRAQRPYRILYWRTET